MHATLSLVLLACSPAAFADVLIVGPPGSGAEFTDLPLAVIAANSGDQIRMLPGTYGGASVSKSLEIIGAGADQVFIRLANPFQGAMIVSGLPAGEHVHLAGMSFDSSGSVADSAGVTVQSCEGTVSIDACALESPGSDLVSRGLRVIDSELVFVSDSRISATDLELTPGTHAPAQVGVELVNSTAVFERCTIKGGNAGSMVVALAAGDSDGGAGLRSQSSTVVLENSQVSGGTGGVYLAGTATGRGGAGLNPVGSVVVLGGDTLVEGGDTKTFPLTAAGLGGIGMLVESASVIQVGPDTLIEGGANPIGMGLAPDITAPGSASIQQLTERFTTLTAVNDDSGPSAKVDLTASGEPGRQLIVFVELGVSAPTSLPFLAGPLVISPFAATEVSNVVLPGSGETAFSVSGSAPAVMIGKPAVFQALELNPVSGKLRVSMPAGTTLAF